MREGRGRGGEKEGKELMNRGVSGGGGEEEGRALGTGGGWINRR